MAAGRTSAMASEWPARQTSGAAPRLGGLYGRGAAPVTSAQRGLLLPGLAHGREPPPRGVRDAKAARRLREPKKRVTRVVSVFGERVRGGLVGDQRLVNAMRFLQANLELARKIARRDVTIVGGDDLARFGQQPLFGILLAR